MFENVDGRTDDGRTTDAGVTGILIAHLGAFGSGELKSKFREFMSPATFCLYELSWNNLFRRTENRNKT